MPEAYRYICRNWNMERAGKKGVLFFDSGARKIIRASDDVCQLCCWISKTKLRIPGTTSKSRPFLLPQCFSSLSWLKESPPNILFYLLLFIYFNYVHSVRLQSVIPSLVCHSYTHRNQVQFYLLWIHLAVFYSYIWLLYINRLITYCLVFIYYNI